MEYVNLQEHIAHAITNRGLKLIINTTEQCNLRCVYCYESFAVKAMPPEIATAILHFVEKRAIIGIDWLEIEFFGGEPLAAWRVVDRLSKEIYNICCRYSVRLLGSLTTNATKLTESRMDALARTNFTSYQITLDGPQYIHDKRRVTSNGKGTYATIWQNLQMLKRSDYDLNVILRIHFDSITVATLTQSPSFIEELATAFLLGDDRFCLQFNAVEPWAKTPSDAAAFFTSHREMIEARRFLLNHAISVGITPGQLPQYAEPTPTGESGCVVCYAARANSFVVRPDGRLSKCTVALDDDRNCVGRIASTGELLVDHQRHMPWLRGLISADAAHLQCPAIGYVTI
jgi:uncharacterized protein